MNTLLRIAAILLVSISLMTAHAAAPAGKREPIYDPKADAKKLVADAVARAHTENQRVLVMFGGNWCGWCYLLHDLFQSDQKIGQRLDLDYQLVMLDTEAPGANELFKAYGAERKGVPYLTVLDDQGKVLTNQDTGSLEDGPKHDPAKVQAFLDKWAVERVDTQALLADALKKATAEQKRVFVHFSSVGCGWCRKLEQFLAKPDIAPVFGKDFVDVGIDVSRMKNAAELSKKYGAHGGVPWMVILDADGKSLITSDGPRGNIGFPYEPDEIEHFVKMLNTTRQNLSEADVSFLQESLKKNAAEIAAAGKK